MVLTEQLLSFVHVRLLFHYMQTGQLEIISKVALPGAARRISATFCPSLQPCDPEYMVAGGEDTMVYIYDISRPSGRPAVVNQLQVNLQLHVLYLLMCVCWPFVGCILYLAAWRVFNIAEQACV